MASRAGLVTGGSSGIGKALARALGQEGYAVTIAGRDERKLTTAADELRAEGIAVEAVRTDLADEQAIEALVEAHERAHGRMDVLVNSAADGTSGLTIADLPTDVLDRNLDVNLRALFLTLRASMPMLRQAGAEHGKALVVNLSSYAGKSGQPWLSVYSATKAGVVGWTQAMNKELGAEGVKSVALCPGFVDTDMTDFVKGSVEAADMIRPEDIAAAVRFVLSLSPKCVVPEIVFERPGESL
jgi:NAD(P)-dependent dehydrogenase (short-subunit alcohol dehydrogenase family)